MKRFKTHILENDLQEGVNDPAIFKAIFLAGGPGSGKSFVVNQLALPALGYKLINSDDAFERALAKANLDFSPDNIASPKGQAAREKAKYITGKKMQMAIDGRLGLVIDGTGKDYDKIKIQVDKLRELGYAVMMVFANVDLDVTLQRNRMRARTLPDEMVKKMWLDVQKNIGKFQNLFRSRMIIVDNTDPAESRKILASTYKKVAAWTKADPENPIAMRWINQQRKARSVKEETEMSNESDAYGFKKVMSKTINRTAYKKALEILKDVLARKAKEAGGVKKMKHSDVYYAAQIAKQFTGVDARTLASMLQTETIDETGGAGEWGTDKLTKRYKKDTPGESDGS